ncbi:MAG: DUF2071 domain-containing protein [Lapillicoccus sp.]
MPVPRLSGEIQRRLLVNYRVDPEWIAKVLPPPFSPQVVNGYAVAGICLIRLGSMRPSLLPAWVGLGSENAAHRVAVTWPTPEGLGHGVYIPRRDSSSLTNVLVGGRLFPGEHHLARFDVEEDDEQIAVAFSSRDHSASVDVRVQVTSDLNDSQLFADVESASAFFESGSVGYSATRDPGRFDGLALETNAWRVEPAQVLQARSTFFDDAVTFPRGTAQLDDALVMRRIPVTWRPIPALAVNRDNPGADSRPSQSTETVV